MTFSERRMLKARNKILNKMLDFDEAVDYTNNELFKDCHIVPEEKNGVLTGKYYLLPDEIIREQNGEENVRIQNKESFRERVRYDKAPVLKYNNYQVAPRYHAQDWAR